MPNPPDVARALLDCLLPRDARETVAGDLLEEYRAGRLPALGKFRGDLWYWRQVGGFWLRAYWWCLAPVLVLFVLHDVFNTFRAPSGASYLDGLPALAAAPISPAVAIPFFGLAGAYGSWRTRRWDGGFVAALGLFVALWSCMMVWWNVTWYPFAQIQESNPFWIQAWQWSTHRTQPPSDATFLSWIFWDNVGASIVGGVAMLTASVVCGGIGAAVGLSALRRPPAAAERP